MNLYGTIKRLKVDFILLHDHVKLSTHSIQTESHVAYLKPGLEIHVVICFKVDYLLIIDYLHAKSSMVRLFATKNLAM